jgi:hypothetical protein
MAESEEPNDSLLWSVIGFIFVMLVIGTYMGKYNDGSLAGNGAPAGTGSTASQQINTPKTGGLFGRFLSAKPIVEGGRVVNAAIVRVRQTPGGAIIGEQEKRALADVIEGPVTAFGDVWYKLNYKKAPDGWVSDSEVTANVGTFRALNIIPIVFSILRPIGLLLTIIFLIILIMIVVRQRKTVALIHKKKILEKETEGSNAFAKRISRGTANEVRVENSTKTEANIFQATAPPVNHTATSTSQIPTDAVKETAPTNLPTGDISGLLFKKSGTKLDEKTGGPKNTKWERVQRLLNSYNTNDWKQSIMEADIMLEEMLNKMGYKGNGIGEMLKQIEESDFITLNKAWEAHKVRNNIAHRGGDQVLSKDEAERVVGLYKKVFEEFYYI